MNNLNIKIDNYLFEDIFKLNEEDSNKVGINFKGVPYTYKEIEKSIDYYCHILVNKGVKPSEHVALLGMNCYNWIVAFFAIIKVGAVAVLFNYMSKHETLVELIKYTDCKYICYGKYIALVKQDDEFDLLLKETGISKEQSISMRYRHINFKEILQKEDIKPFTSPLSREEDSKRTSYIIFTTGTTAKPKAACISQYAMMNIIYLNFGALSTAFTDKFMCLLPMFHCFGLLVANAALAFKRTLFLNSLSNKVSIYKEFFKNKCDNYASVSTIFDQLAKAPFWWIHNKNFVKHCIVGGGFTSETEFEILEKKYGKDKFLNGYGQTECSPMISLVYPDAPNEKKKTTVGTLMKDIEVAFMDPASKKLLPQGQPGEILVKGYNVFNGYYKVEKDQQPFDKNGYLHTGDLGYLDEDGYLILQGRLKDIIIRKGENISPKEIEEELRKFKEFGNVRVLGFPSADEGEYIIGCVELLKKPLHFVEEHYLDELRKTLPSIKVPEHIVYVDKFPLTANGKLDEMKLKEICLMKLAKYLNEGLLAKKTRILMDKAIEKRQ